MSSAVRYAVPDGASALFGWCSSMISTESKNRAACSANRIVSTAPIAHLLWRSFVEPELRWCVAHASDAAPGTDSGNDPLPVTRGLRRLGGGRS